MAMTGIIIGKKDMAMKPRKTNSSFFLFLIGSPVAQACLKEERAIKACAGDQRRRERLMGPGLFYRPVK